MKKIVIIPAYNESESIKQTVEEIKRKAPEFDYVVVNDCSTDKTKEICENNGFNVINLPINLGIGGAVQTGYQVMDIIKGMRWLFKWWVMDNIIRNF